MADKDYYTANRSDYVFWNLIDRSGGPEACHPYRGWLDKDGYGWYSGPAKLARARTHRAHRLAWLLMVGPLPAGKPFVLHDCHTRYAKLDVSYRACCNIAHLRPGTAKENWDDVVSSGRENAASGSRHWTRTMPSAIRQGVAHHAAVLDVFDVMAIRASTASSAELSAIYGIGTGAIWNIRTGKRWAHIPSGDNRWTRKRHDAAKTPPPAMPGEFNPAAVLTEAKVLEILSSQETGATLARFYGVSKGTISAIRTRKTWRHLIP